MYFLIETREQLIKFIDKKFNNVFVYVIQNNDNIHPIQSKIIALYIRPIDSETGYIINVQHNDSIRIDGLNINKILSKFNTLYCIDKKDILHHIKHDNIIDICEEKYTFNNNLHNYYSNYSKDVNCIIPITKLFEYCENMYSEVQDKITNCVNLFYNNKVSVIFNWIEQQGLKVNKELFEKYFHKIDGDIIYTKYNYKTTTKRPYNKFNNVNYSALNKNDGCRESFIARNDLLVEVDISAYHVHLIANQINYKFDNSDIHTHFAKLYNCDYDTSKQITFKQIYGNIDIKYENIEFFKLIKIFINETYNKFKTDGYYICKYSGHRIKYSDDISANKLYNYIIQNLESSINIYILIDLYKLLKNKKTKLVLYTFDSFLLDFDYSEKSIQYEILNIFKKYKLNVKIKKGLNYSFNGR